MNIWQNGLSGRWKGRALAGLLLLLMGPFAKAEEGSRAPFSKEWARQKVELAVRLQSEENRPLEALAHWLELLSYPEELARDTALHRKVNNRIASVLRILGLYAEQGPYLRKYVELSLAQVDRYPVAVYFAMSDLAGYYTRMQRPDSALYQYRRAKEVIFNAKDRRRYTLEISSLNNIGRCFWGQEQYDSARYYYETALVGFLDSASRDTGLWLAINDNLAESYLQEGDLAASLEKYEQNLRLVERYTKSPPGSARARWIKTGMGIARVREAEGRIADAIAILHRAEDKFASEPGPLSPQIQNEVYGMIARLYRRVGRNEWAVAYQERQLALMGEIVEQNQRNMGISRRELGKFQVNRLNEQMAAQKQAAEAELALAESQAVARMAVISVLAVLIIGGLLVLIIRRRRLQQRKEDRQRMERALMAAELKEKELEKRNLELEISKEQNEKEKIRLALEYKRKDVEAMALDLSRKKEWAKRLLAFTRSLRNMREVDRLLSLSDLESEIKSQLRTGERQQIMQEQVEVVNHEFYQTLSQRFPKIASSEKELCGFIRMKLTNSEIAVLRNISEASVRTARYRLRKKLNLKKGESLDVFIEGLT
ncbi:MAG: tetratricopeptide repeat protein [Bacteroidota bacterium]